MSYEIIMAVGTSTLGWMRRIDSSLGLPAGWLPGAPLSKRPPNSSAWKSRLRPLCANDKTCAELDSCAGLLQRRKIQSEELAAVHLLVSDTDAARWVAELLRHLLPLRFHDRLKVGLRPLSGLNPEDPRMTTSGEALKDLVRAGAALVKQAREHGRQPIINATPGFKAESGLLLLVGALLGTEVFYLYEDMKRTLIFPPLPIDWRAAVVGPELKALLERVNTVVTEEELAQEARSAGIDPAILWPFVEGAIVDGKWHHATSAFGELLIQTWAEPLDEPPARDSVFEVRLGAKEPGHRPVDTEALARQIGERLGFVTCVSEWRWTAERWEEDGLLLPYDSDAPAGIIRLRLRSRDGRSVDFVVKTTAASRLQWMSALTIAGEAFGRANVARQVADSIGRGAFKASKTGKQESDETRLQRFRPVVEMVRKRLERKSRSDGAPAATQDDFERLDVIALLLTRWGQWEQANEEQEARIDELSGDLRVAKAKALSAQKQLGGFRKTVQKLEQRIGRLESETARIRQERDSLLAERDRLARDLELASPHYSFLVLDPDPGTETPPYDFGIEITEPRLRVPGAVYLDHHGWDVRTTTPSACEQALALPDEQLPRPGAVLASIRVDPDAVAAMAVLVARSLGHSVDASLVKAVGQMDRLGPIAEHGLSMGRRNAAFAIDRVVLDERRSLEERVRFVQRVLEGKASGKELALLRREREAELEQARIKAKVTDVVSGVLVLVESVAPFALHVGYERASTVVAFNPAFPRTSGGTMRKFTVARRDPSVPTDIKSIADALNRLEAERRGVTLEELPSQWGGRDTIIGSPQGVETALSLDEVITVVRHHLDQRTC